MKFSSPNLPSPKTNRNASRSTATRHGPAIGYCQVHCRKAAWSDRVAPIRMQAQQLERAGADRRTGFAKLGQLEDLVGLASSTIPTAWPHLLSNSQNGYLELFSQHQPSSYRPNAMCCLRYQQQRQRYQSQGIGNTPNIIGLNAEVTDVVIFDPTSASVNATATVQGGAATVPLYSTAPESITVAVGATLTYMIAGGASPYTVTSSNVNVLTVSQSGTTFTASSVAAGLATMSIHDANSTVVNIMVTVE